MFWGPKTWPLPLEIPVCTRIRVPGTVLPRLKGYTLINGVGQFWDSKKSTRPHLQGYTLVNGVRFRVYPYKWGRVYPYKRGRVYPCKWVCRGGVWKTYSFLWFDVCELFIGCVCNECNSFLLCTCPYSFYFY